MQSQIIVLDLETFCTDAVDDCASSPSEYLPEFRIAFCVKCRTALVCSGAVVNEFRDLPIARTAAEIGVLPGGSPSIPFLKPPLRDSSKWTVRKGALSGRYWKVNTPTEQRYHRIWGRCLCYVFRMSQLAKTLNDSTTELSSLVPTDVQISAMDRIWTLLLRLSPTPELTLELLIF
ncbi:uncharacterized protein BDZ99DRAFT_515826 [Mytilinidion resinicola]|uniref:Uncharacterized protein n=1 Tax=Mytilinidion resinicola TaxID=574789 RepID=A0A6A6Z2W1_9PEZI|nr:uncharacterized protein BDZ99DRAFT_515826 [Mytilinidion resinicola]KAF2815069.1 hypothetical protein BDZ99DRAFT_515826 [Mytilinidion resinicola]